MTDRPTIVIEFDKYKPIEHVLENYVRIFLTGESFQIGDEQNVRTTNRRGIRPYHV